MFYLQTNTHSRIKTIDGRENRQRFQTVRQLKLYPLSNKAEREILYDKDLKIHFESFESYRSYEIEVVAVLVDFDREIRKAQDFRRRVNYKYDWIHAERCSNGKITNIGNLDELRSNWKVLKRTLQRDYIGIAVDNYLEKTSSQFSNDAHFEGIFTQYYEYGLLFPKIPNKHAPDWQGKRMIYLDTSHDSHVIEIVTLSEENEEFRIYNIAFEQNADNEPVNLISFNGTLEWDKKDNLIQRCDITVKYAYDELIINEAHFNIERIVEPNNNNSQ